MKWSLKISLKRILSKNITYIIIILLITISINWFVIGNLNSIIDNDNNMISSPEIDSTLVIGHLTEITDNLKEGKREKYPMGQHESTPVYLIPCILLILIFSIKAITAMNIMYLFSFFLTGVAMYYFSKYLTKNNFISIFAGITYMASNYMMYQFVIGHGNLVQMQWIPLVLLFMMKSIDTHNLKYGILTGVFASIQLHASTQYFVYLTTIVPFILILKYKKQIFSSKTIKQLAIALFVFLVLSTPYIVSRLSIETETRDTNKNLTTNWRLNSAKELVSFNSILQINPVLIILTMLGTALIVIKKQKNRYPYIVGLIVTILLAIGPINKFSLYYLILKFWPFINKFRTPQRYFPLILLFSTIIATTGLKQLIKNKQMKKQIAIISIIILVEIALSMIFSPYFSSLKIAEFPLELL